MSDAVQSDAVRPEAPRGAGTQWPAVSYETLPWESRHEQGAASRSQIRRHRGPYQAAVVPEIAGQGLVLPSEVSAEAEDAATEIARFDAGMGGEIAPFGAVLLRSESAASSQIENLTASARAIAEAEIGDTRRHNAAQIVANTHAMEAAIALADHLDVNAILAMHRALMGVHAPGMAGRWREELISRVCRRSDSIPTIMKSPPVLTP